MRRPNPPFIHCYTGTGFFSSLRWIIRIAEPAVGAVFLE